MRITNELESIDTKKYKKTELGFLPVEWNLMRLYEIGDIVTGSTPNTKIVDYYGGDYLFVTPGDISDKKYVSDTEKKLTKKGFDVSRKIPKNSIMVTCIGYIGKIAMTDREVTTNQQINSIIPNKGIISDYIYYSLDYYFNRSKNRVIEHQVVPIINKTKFSHFLLPIPSIFEQQKIADILSTWDKAIELKEKLIEQKKEQKKGLMQLLFTGIIRVNEVDRINGEQLKKRIELIKRGLIPDGYKATKLGIIPAEWRVVHLKEKFQRLTRKNNINNTNVLTISAQHGLISQGNFFNKSVASENLSNYYLLKKGDFAYNKSYSNGYPYGAIKVLEQYESGVVSPLYICFSPKEENKCPEFYKYYFDAGFLNREIHAIAQEGARNHGLLNISVDDFFNTYIVDMDEQEMKQITDIVSIAIKEIKLLEQHLESLKQQKKGLMQLLLTGKVRVKC